MGFLQCGNAVVLVLVALCTTGTFGTNAFDHHQLIKKFGGEFKCPYASLWLSKGPEQAAKELGLKSLPEEEHRQERELQPPNVLCEIAPGAIGAAHQAGYNGGYPLDCPGVPGESSPYQWPTAWTADVDSKSVPFGNDTVIFHSIGRVFYRLDRNWKRADTTYTRGLQRSVGQGPCAPEDAVDDPGSALLACRRDSDERRTMIHRGGKMVFITWKNGTTDDNVANIQNCTWLDLQIVGNVRPDWFMDKRGDDTDVQYLGDQHVYYNGMPKLVKQWRKKDFANQYFTMSMLGNPSDDGIHWPMILNVPGEGFGDDFLTIYTNHSTLSDDDDDLFLLDEALVASGGSCEQTGQGGGVGPPTGTVKIPSNLEIDENSWFSNEYTFSPVWDPPPKPVPEQGLVDEDGDRTQAITEAGKVTIGSCYDSTSQSVEMTFSFNDIDETDQGGLPWIAIGYRQDEECVMNKNGADTDIILIAAAPSGAANAFKGKLPAAARSRNETAVTSIYTTLSPLESAERYSDVSLTAPSDDGVTEQERSSSSDSVVLSFKQSMDQVPEVMHLMYAVGSTPQMGYHATRMCFEVTQFPDCAGVPTSSGFRATPAVAAAMVMSLWALSLLF